MVSRTPPRRDLRGGKPSHHCTPPAIDSAHWQSARRAQIQTHLHLAHPEFKCAPACESPAWEDPARNARSKEAPHATLLPFESEKLAIAHALDLRTTGESTALGVERRVLWLSGQDKTWRFRFTAELHHRPVDFHALAFNDSGWSPVAVPMSWELLVCMSHSPHAAAHPHTRAPVGPRK